MRSDVAVLFDIDGTLVRKTGPHHRDALSIAARRIFGVEATTDGIPVHGMLDPDILAAMLERAGVSEARRAMPELQHAAEEHYLAECPDLRFAVCPGVTELLARLEHAQIPTALVTGNFTRIGWRKLEAAGLKQYFRYGAFAEMAATRAGLAAIAARELGSPQRVLLVGDAPSDIEAAKANGFVSVAVHTGVSNREDLAPLQPDYLLPSLRLFPLTL